MLRVVIAFLLLIFLPVSTAFAFRAKEQVNSTQGVDIDSTITKTIGPSKEQKKEQRKKRRTSAEYLKKKKKIGKIDAKLQNKQRELEFLQNRLEIKKKKLEDLVPADNEKGEE